MVSRQLKDKHTHTHIHTHTNSHRSKSVSVHLIRETPRVKESRKENLFKLISALLTVVFKLVDGWHE